MSPKVSNGETDLPLPSRYIVGIDLGTTNCAAAFVDATADSWSVETMLIPQWTDWGQTENRTTLPSFHYQLDADQAKTQSQPYVVGALARDAGMRQPGRRIASAKSWLSHDAVDRSADLLPWHGDSDVQRMSPVEISSRYLAHIRDAWDAQHSGAPLAQQDVVITLPASFDEVARELTVAAAKRAGLPRVFLIEEPQAAFYAWIDRHRDDWSDRVGAGDLILVCDIGGGTSDFTLIRVRPAGDDQSQVQFHRVAVGKHLILGGDNLDLALAKFAEARFSPGKPLPPRDWDRLIQVCRGAKEVLFSAERPENYSINLAGEGSRLIGGSRTTTITSAEADQILLEGFFPLVAAQDEPEEGESGFREFGLPYAHDPAITRHLAAFLATHSRAGLDSGDTDSAVSPGLILFNGGVMAAERFRNRIVDCVKNWFGERPQVLDADRLDLAVAHGAAYYGMVRLGHGVRIAANLARSYYMQVSDQPPETMCVIPGSAEPGQTFAPAPSLRLELGTPVQFPLWVSSTRLADAAGDLVPLDRASISPLPPIRTVLTRGKKRIQQAIDVRIETELSEIGTLGLFAVDVESGQRWRLEFDIRSTLETDREVHTGEGESLGIVDSETVEQSCSVLRNLFAREIPKTDVIAPGKAMARLREAVGMDRPDWPPSLLRDLWQVLMDHADGRKMSAAHESRWLNLVGYCLRPGYGMAVDDWRVAEVWRSVHKKLTFPTPATRTESLILWRRIAGGLTSGQQTQLFTPLMSSLVNRAVKLEAHEANELWRLAGSLEWISADQKTTLAQAAIDRGSKKSADPYRLALVWAVGRLASRRPVYGPLNTVVSASRASVLVIKLIEHVEAQTTGLDSVGNQLLAATQLAVMQIAGRTGDRYRDLTDDVRDEVLRWLRNTEAPRRYVEVLEAGFDESTEAFDSAAIFGEALPLGIRLVR